MKNNNDSSNLNLIDENQKKPNKNLINIKQIYKSIPKNKRRKKYILVYFILGIILLFLLFMLFYKIKIPLNESIKNSIFPKMTNNSEYSTNTIDKKEKSNKANDQIKEVLLNIINEGLNQTREDYKQVKEDINKIKDELNKANEEANIANEKTKKIKDDINKIKEDVDNT